MGMSRRPNCGTQRTERWQSGPWTVDRGPWTVDRGPWTVDSRQWIMDSRHPEDLEADTETINNRESVKVSPFDKAEALPCFGARGSISRCEIMIAMHESLSSASNP